MISPSALSGAQLKMAEDERKGRGRDQRDEHPIPHAYRR
jgi:hypothetical protein